MLHSAQLHIQTNIEWIASIACAYINADSMKPWWWWWWWWW